MKDINGIKRGEVVTLNASRVPLSGVKFNAGDKLKFLSLYGARLVRLSRVGDNAKLTVLMEDIGYAHNPVAQVAPLAAPAPASGRVGRRCAARA